MKLTGFAAAPVVALAAFGAVVAGAPTAAADCVNSGGTTICSQGDVRGADSSGSGTYAPYPCEYDWYCYDGGGVGVVFGAGDGDVGLPGTPGNRPEVSPHRGPSRDGGGRGRR
ncbi:hypothetical protein [Mycolicibacterium fallax]|uniref:Uncharacterized protein n=1 Tax=Mycolicibacterium fallax TaxID=1793 RepID=A0A1X1RD85_MYCFA|nr:hypothetical protein [Mycolicibacterium fallax]ORV03126.1 hypothetical protein AWC04_10855 [Mycolicibacterium fallax]BBY98875.1 hypothetical protein MFAL_23420 [Mycolicibacterium fallax]HOW93005.1 hypothetical protein [Mycolicibacterium fallax]HSA40195.1 hypothetical protein [Mycobacterium sp.]